ncbi:hypothetical protein FA13DRAFT_1735284 [Coprinellus micaceus]|uniref:Uncharacterized protein n=1 Tax=Coprinellus micaceus TaxID=71717 RepID=A0A4Y7T3M1_COPMI|nr:hypothetical protein FA13DRAFT_1735284 [Coprinellus micaceus]
MTLNNGYHPPQGMDSLNKADKNVVRVTALGWGRWSVSEVHSNHTRVHTVYPSEPKALRSNQGPHPSFRLRV